MPKGGKRAGAGRPIGSGKYSEPTKAVRVPISIIGKITQLAEGINYELPLYSSKVSAGLPSPADDSVEDRWNINEHFVKHPASTFLLKVSGNSMIKAGIHADDILIVDRSLEVKHGKIVITALNDRLTVKRLYKKQGKVILIPENDDFSPIELDDSDTLHIWGVVTGVIRSL